jgi:uncharacterized protein with ParB-like and HNH nuclease domain
MKTPSYLRKPQIQYLYQLLDDIQNGTLFVPKFQHCLVWNNKQRLELLRSIKEEMPIGSIIVWRTSQHRLATFDKLGGRPLPKPTAVHTTYLLDGHQRLSTLFSALEGTSDGNFFMT